MKITEKFNNKIDLLLRGTSVILLKNLNLEIVPIFFLFTSNTEFLTCANLLSELGDSLVFHKSILYRRKLGRPI